MPKLKLLIVGERVHEVGLRAKLISLAIELGIERFMASNVLKNGGQAVLVLLDANKEKLQAFKDLWKDRLPNIAIVKDVMEEEFQGEVPSIYHTMLAFEFEHWDKAIPILVEIRDGVKAVGKKVDDVGKKVEGVGKKVEDVGKKVDEAKEDLGRRIDFVANKIDEVGRKVDGIREDFKS